MSDTALKQEGTVTTNNLPEQDNSKLIFVKSHSVGTDAKGRQKIDLRFSEEETKMLIEEMGKIKNRAKLQLHIGETSAFVFLKEVQPKGASFSKGMKQVATNIKDKLAAFKQGK